MSNAFVTELDLPNVARYRLPGDTSDGPAVRRAVADAITNGRGGIYFPPGTYDIDRDGANDWGINVSGADGFTIVGSGPATKIRIDGIDLGSQDFSLFLIDGGTRCFAIRNLALDGNRANVTNPAVTYLLNIDAAEQCEVQTLFVSECPGTDSAGIRVGDTLGGATHLILRNLRVFDCTDRAVLLEDVVSGLIFEDSVLFDCQDGIELSPAGAGIAADYILDNVLINVTENAILLSAELASAGPVRVILSNNIVTGGRVLITESVNVTVNDSIFTGTFSGDCLAIQDTAEQVSVTGCLLSAADALRVEALAGQQSDIVSILGNTVTLPAAGPSFGIRVEGGGLVKVSGNVMRALAVAATSYIQVDGIGVLDNLVITENRLFGGGTAAHISVDANDAAVEAMTVSYNFTEEATGADVLDFAVSGTGSFACVPQIQGNSVQGTLLAIADLALFAEPAYICGGNGAATGGLDNGGTWYAVSGDPALAGVLTGYIGDIAHRLDGGAGTALYVKEAGQGTSGAGEWVAK